MLILLCSLNLIFSFKTIFYFLCDLRLLSIIGILPHMYLHFHLIELGLLFFLLFALQFYILFFELFLFFTSYHSLNAIDLNSLFIFALLSAFVLFSPLCGTAISFLIVDSRVPIISSLLNIYIAKSILLEENKMIK